LTANIAIVH